MKAVVIEQFGGPEVLQLQDVPVPSPRQGEILVKVRAVSVNPTIDFGVREGRYFKPTTLPHVLGVDPSGEVVAVGEGVSGPEVGDRVATTPWVARATQGSVSTMLGVQCWGGYAQYICVPADTVHAIPPALSFAEATVAVRHGPLAFRMLENRAGLKKGERLLVTGASGGLGSAALQIGRLLGAQTIAAAGSSDRAQSVEPHASLGIINYGQEDLENGVARLVGENGVDIVIETTGVPDLFSAAFNCLGRMGRIVTAGGRQAGRANIDIRLLYRKQLSIFGCTSADPADVERSLEAASKGNLITPARILGLARAVEAHRLVESGNHIGKIVLDPWEDIE